VATKNVAASPATFQKPKEIEVSETGIPGAKGSMNTKKAERGPPEDEIERVCELITGYLARYPQAEDCLESITEWWILEQTIRVEMSKVQRALDRLIERNVVKECRRIDGRVTYRLNPDGDRGG